MKIIKEDGEAPVSTPPATVSGDIAQTPTKLLGKPLFRLPQDMFYKVGFTDRTQNGWYKKFYGTELGDWCKNNKGKKFMIQLEGNDIFIDCESK